MPFYLFLYVFCIWPFLQKILLSFINLPLIPLLQVHKSVVFLRPILKNWVGNVYLNFTMQNNIKVITLGTVLENCFTCCHVYNFEVFNNLIVLTILQLFLMLEKFDFFDNIHGFLYFLLGSFEVGNCQ